jgi:hypothetical protein
MTKEKTLKLLNLNKIEDLGHQKYIFRLTLQQQKEVWKHFGDYLNDKWEMNTCYKCSEIENTYDLIWLTSEDFEPKMNEIVPQKAYKKYDALCEPCYLEIIN